MTRDPMIGKRFNQYEIEDFLGQGGMSTVYRAYQHGVNRTVAIKVLPRELLHQADFLKRFQHEAEVIARLEHFHILPVYDAGEWDGLPYIVMRYLSGGTLADRLAPATTIPAEELLPVIRQVSDALDYAHGHGVIHRDVKPSNILFDDRANAYLSDFGLAGVGEATATASGIGAFGTPEYLAPEIASGQEVTYAVDVYALGIVLFQALTGRFPFKDSSPLKTAMLHVKQPAPMPRTINKYLSPYVEAVVIRSLAKDPTARYPSAGALAEALDQAAHMTPTIDAASQMPTANRSSRPVIPPPEKPARKSGRQPGRIPWLLIGALIVTAVVVLFALQFTVQQEADKAATAAARANGTQVAASTLSAAVGGTGTAIGATQLAADLLAGRRAAPTATPTATATATPTPTATATFTPAPTPLGGGSGVIAYVSEQTGNPEIFLLDLSSNIATQVTNNKSFDGAPVWSPNGRLLAFLTEQFGQGTHIALADSSGGDLREVTHDFQKDTFPGWISDNEVAFMAQEGPRTILRKVNTDGVQKDIVQVTPGVIVSLLDWLPGGTSAIYYGLIPRGDVEIASLDTTTMAKTMLTDSQGDIGEMAFSPDRSKAVYTQTITGRSQLFLADTNCPVINQCSPQRITDDTYSYHAPRFSPDGTLILVTANRAGNDDLWLLDLSGNVIRQVTSDPAKEGQGSWRP